MRRVLAVIALILLTAGLTPVWAQPANSAQDASTPKPPPPPPMISRWVDAHGQVHYGDALPPDAPEQTTEIGPTQSATPEQKAQAEAQMQQYRDYLNPQAAASPNTAEPQPTLVDDSCAGQWARFNAAVACANQYYVVGGGLKNEVAQHCQVVPRPQCPPPGP